jgi:hypothetical protein
MTNRRSLLVILLVTLLLSACVELGDPTAPTPVSESAVQPPDGQDTPQNFAPVEMGAPVWFSHSTGIFRIQYPQNWEIEEQSSGTDITTRFHSPEGNGLFSVTVVEVPNAEQLGSEQLGNLLRDTLTTMSGDAENLSLGDPQPQSDGSVRITATQDVVQEGFTGTMLVNSFVQANGDYISILIFSLPQEQFETHTATIDQVLGSYTVYPDMAMGDGSGDAAPQAGDAAPAGGNGGLTPYESPNGVFRLDIPRGWQVIDRSVTGELLISMVDPNGGGMIFVAITDLGTSGEQVALAALSDALTRGVEQAFGSYEGLIVSEPEMQSDDRISAHFSFDSPGSLGVMEGVSYAQIDGSYLSMLMVVFSQEQIAAGNTNRDAIISSYQVDPSASLP